jgi:hypothetical protein
LSYCHDNCIKTVLRGREAILLQCGNITFDGFAYVGYGPGLALPLADAARKAWTLYHPITVFTGIEDYLPHRSLLN